MRDPPGRDPEQGIKVTTAPPGMKVGPTHTPSLYMYIHINRYMYVYMYIMCVYMKI